MMFDLSSRRALVTGGGRGIGLAVVGALAECGADVVLTTRSQRAADAALAALPEGLSVSASVCDVTDFEGMAAILSKPVDILINNAGVIGPIGRIEDIDIHEWADNHRINVTSAMNVLRLVLPGMLDGGGTVVNLSSGAASQAMEGWSAYCSGKAALAMITRCIHLEYGKMGVRAFGFAPGLVDTDMQATIRDSGVNPISEVPRDKLRPAEEPARAVAWLCTSAADSFAGQEVDVRTKEIRELCGLEPIE